jgi:hypothetical protein
MSYAQPQHGGAADAYYQEGQQDIGMRNRQQYQTPPAQQQYQNGQQQQYQQQAAPQYQQGPPPYKQPNYGGGEKQDFQQTFKVDKPKLNDI